MRFIGLSISLDVEKVSEDTSYRLWNKCSQHRGRQTVALHESQSGAPFHRFVSSKYETYRAISIRLRPTASDAHLVDRAHSSSLRHFRVEIYSPRQALTVLVTMLVRLERHGTDLLNTNTSLAQTIRKVRREVSESGVHSTPHMSLQSTY